MKASVFFYPNEPKVNKQKRKVPIYLRICFQRKKSECRLPAEIDINDLSKWDPITMRIQERNSPLNHYLNRLEQKFNEYVLQQGHSVTNLSPEQIKNYVLGIEEKQKIYVLKFADDYFEKSVLNNVNKTPGTVKNYRRAINHLTFFLKHTKQESLLVENLSYETASDFKNYLINSIPELDKTGMTEVSAAGIIKKFRTVFSHAVELELLKNNPFKKVKIKTRSPKKERLSLEEVKKIEALDLRIYPTQVLYRDIFLCSVYTGLGYYDIINLTWENLEFRNDGNLKLKISRQKTDVLTESFLTDKAKTIILKYKKGENPVAATNVFPYRSNKEMNSQLKLLALLAGIPIRLTTHIARHTFRQLLAESEIMDYGVIKRMMGQSRNGDVDEVYYSVTEKALINAKNKFEIFLN